MTAKIIIIGTLLASLGSPIPSTCNLSIQQKPVKHYRLPQENHHSHTLKDTITVGETQLHLAITTEIYRHGSFRQINAVKGHYLGLGKSPVVMTLENPQVEIVSDSGFPSIHLNYKISGILVAKVDSNTPEKVIKQLEKDGFSYSGKQGQISYYHKGFVHEKQLGIYHFS